jgi:phage terminase large subunit-like protein
MASISAAVSLSPSRATTPPFELTERQVEANRLLGSPARHILLRGGARSGKTFLLIRAIVIRALKADRSTHAVMRFRFNHLKGSIIYDTLPKVVSLCWPGLKYHQDKSDWFAEFPNRSRIWFGGLDDKERTEKVLGQEHSTILLNECSQISYDARNKMVTRLAQTSGLALKAYYDCNPPTIGHWTYRMFEKKTEPRSGEALAEPNAYATMQMNPEHNRTNLPPDYLAELNALPARDRIRFLDGNYQAQVDNALWSLDTIRREAIHKTEAEREALINRMERIVVAVDPSGCEGPEDSRSDEIGIIVAGRDRAGVGHVLADLSGHYSPSQWANASVKAFDDWRADTILAERNFGGAMVASTIRTARSSVNVRVITASRGKVARAEPIAALYEKTPGRGSMVVHHGSFPDLEEQMVYFSTGGYLGSRSPDRADAMIWALTELMLGQAVPIVGAIVAMTPRDSGITG